MNSYQNSYQHSYLEHHLHVGTGAAADDEPLHELATSWNNERCRLPWKLAAWIVLIGSAFLFVASGDLPGISLFVRNRNSPSTQKTKKGLGTTGKSAKTPKILTVGNRKAKGSIQSGKILDRK